MVLGRKRRLLDVHLAIAAAAVEQEKSQTNKNNAKQILDPVIIALWTSSESGNGRRVHAPSHGHAYTAVALPGASKYVCQGCAMQCEDGRVS